MSAVTFFLSAYDNAPDYDFLNRLICQWRKVEEATRRKCNIPSVMDEYPGCFFYKRGFGNQTSPYADQTGGYRHLRTHQDKAQKALSAQDIILHNHAQAQNEESIKPKTIRMSDKNFEPQDPTFDWEAFIQSQYEQEHHRQRRRHLINYEHVGPWFNYFPMIGVKTEYYFRYGGTQTIPPCYGKFQPGSARNNTNNWRVMKDPIRVSHRQIDELNRLLRDRISPYDDPVRPCQPDTAAKKTGTGAKVSVARPVQGTTKAHSMVFCECENWGSKWNEDRTWCKEQNKTHRFFEHPYNFASTGF